MSLLHVFDMDGTLLLDTTASLEIARHLDCLDDLTALEAAFAAGSLDTTGFAARICGLWGSLRPENVVEIFAAAPWIDGLAEVFADIRERGERSLVITMSPDFFAEGLRDLGADGVVASRFPALPFRTQPDPAGILSPEDKVRIVDRTCAELGLDRDRCIAYGDSGSDIPLFRELRHTVAVNAGEPLKELSLFSYEGGDLWAAYELGRACVEGHRGPGGTDGKGRTDGKVLR